MSNDIRLIDATALIEEVQTLKISVGGIDIFPDASRNSIMRIVNEQPTAYDVNAAIAKLKDAIQNGVIKLDYGADKLFEILEGRDV